MSALPEYVSRSKGRDGFPVCPGCDGDLKPLWPERSELEYGYHDSWWCDRCQMGFDIDPDEDPGPVEDEKWPLWHEPEE